MANTTLNWEMRAVLPFLRKDGRLAVLTAYILHANENGRAWPSVDTLCRETGYTSATVVKSKKWLVKAGAIQKVPYSKRFGELELSLHQRVNIMQVTGQITIDDQCYQYLYANELQGEDINILPGKIMDEGANILPSNILPSNTEGITSNKGITIKDSGEPETGTPKNGNGNDKPPTKWQLFCGGIAEHMFGIDIENKALVDASMGRIGPLASAIRTVHQALTQDDKAIPSPEDVELFVIRWRAEREDTDIPLGTKTVPPHWARLMAPDYRPNETTIVAKVAPGSRTFE